MGSPFALIIVSHRKALELLEDFAGRNAMAVGSAEVGGLSGLGYFTQDDLLDTLSLLQHLVVACILYEIAPPSNPTAAARITAFPSLGQFVFSGGHI